jgi:hypothetical protein
MNTGQVLYFQKFLPCPITTSICCHGRSSLSPTSRTHRATSTAPAGRHGWTRRRKRKRGMERGRERGMERGRERGLTNSDGGDALLLLSATVAGAQRPPPPLGDGGDGGRWVTPSPSSPRRRCAPPCTAAPAVRVRRSITAALTAVRVRRLGMGREKLWSRAVKSQVYMEYTYCRRTRALVRWGQVDPRRPQALVRRAYV